MTATGFENLFAFIQLLEDFESDLRIYLFLFPFLRSAKRLLGTQRLGRGKFTPEERPFLLSEELPGSLRQLKPQGDVIADRLKSLQKRNMIAIPGEERVRSKLKKKLRVKISERRSYKEVTIGSRVI
uniref:Ribosome biogenesis protein NOP53 n=1 Tax=Parascaris equorum TaxID=6256 RepID=A0A914RYV6_PAREQ